MTQVSAANRAIHALARWCCYAGGTIMTALALMSVYSVVSRWLFGRPIQGDFELVQIGCAVAVSLFLPWCQLKGGNIIVDFFTTRCSQAAQSRLDAFGALMIGCVMLLIAWRTGVGAVSIKSGGETSMLMGVPIWLPYVGMVPGFFLAALAGFMNAVEHWQSARNPRADDAGSSAGAAPGAAA